MVAFTAEIQLTLVPKDGVGETQHHTFGHDRQSTARSLANDFYQNHKNEYFALASLIFIDRDGERPVYLSIPTSELEVFNWLED